jgi:hypothetical protein
MEEQNVGTVEQGVRMIAGRLASLPRIILLFLSPRRRYTGKAGAEWMSLGLNWLEQAAKWESPPPL